MRSIIVVLMLAGCGGNPVEQAMTVAPDLARPLTLASDGDMASHAADLASADLAHAADLASVPDMSSPPDMATPPDMVPACGAIPPCSSTLACCNGASCINYACCSWNNGPCGVRGIQCCGNEICGIDNKCYGAPGKPCSLNTECRSGTCSGSACT